MPKPKAQKKIVFDAHLPRTRCTKSERAAIDARAAQAGFTLSEYMRRVGTKGKIIIKESKADTGMVRQLLGIGNNLNQYVKRTHIGGLTAQEHDLLFGTIEKLETVLNRLLHDTEGQ